MSKEVYVYLTGGLGNQLFQLMSVLNSIKGEKATVFLDLNIGLPRKTENIVDVLYLNLPQNVVTFNKPASKFVRRVAGFLLRSGISPKRWERNKFLKKLYTILGRVILSCRYRKLMTLTIANNVGRFEFDLKKRALLIGYFQTYDVIRNFDQNTLQEIMQPTRVSDDIEKLVKKALIEKPIFVHIRLTDYLSEKNFGNLAEDYYRRSLESLDLGDRKIWIFSDDIEKVGELLPREYRERYFYVMVKETSPAEMLYLLRFGSDYVIANSTFSWWGAATRFQRGAKVITPKPWFARMREPEALIPPDWIRKQVHY